MGDLVRESEGGARESMGKRVRGPGFESGSQESIGKGVAALSLPVMKKRLGF
jgi:hypothetical protein